MGSDDDQRKSRRVPLTLLGASAVTLVALASEPEQISRNIYRTVQDCEAEYGPGRCQANADGTGQSTVLGPEYNGGSSWFYTFNQGSQGDPTAISHGRSVGVQVSRRGGFGGSAHGYFGGG